MARQLTTDRDLIPGVMMRLKALRAEVAEQYDAKTVERFGALFGVPRTTASEWFRGANLPPVWMMARICALTGVTLDWLVLGDASSLSMDRAIRLVARIEGAEVPAVTVEPAEQPEPVAQKGRRGSAARQRASAKA